jgi:hypothetical protein
VTFDDGTSLTKRPFVVTDTVFQTEFGYKRTCRQSVVSTKNCLSLHFPKNITCLSVSLLRIGQVSSVSYIRTIVYRWVTAVSFCMSVVAVVVVIIVVDT